MANKQLESRMKKRRKYGQDSDDEYEYSEMQFKILKKIPQNPSSENHTVRKNLKNMEASQKFRKHEMS
jgi:hypothetical protein